MNVRVKLLLQGGHVWQFQCSEDDPLIFGLVSALPGAEADSNLPPDGLIQVETAAGERLFLSRSSLVSVEVRSLADGSGSELVSQAQSATKVLPPAAIAPARYARIPQALPADLHAGLIADAVAQESAVPSRPSSDGYRDIGVAATPAVTRAFESWAAETRGALGVPDLLETWLDLRIIALGDRESLPTVERTDEVLTLLYTFHCQPTKVAGCGVRLFDGRVEDDLRRAADTFRDIEASDNELLIVPSDVLCVGLPAKPQTAAFADSLFMIYGALRRGLARER